MSTKCVINRTIFRGKKKEFNENIANKIFDNFVEAFAWLEKFLDERYDEFETTEIHRAGFLDEYIDLSKWDAENNYWYSEIYNCELV